MSAVATIPELDIGADDFSADFSEVTFDPDAPDVDDDVDDDAPPTLSRWNASGWNDRALVDVWQAAKEEYNNHHHPLHPFTPFKADRDLVALSKQRMNDSWKIKMQVKEQIDREKWEAAGGPPPGSSYTTNLWFTSLARASVKNVRKRKLAQAARTSKKSRSDGASPTSSGLESPPHPNRADSPEPYQPEEPTSYRPDVVEFSDISGWDDKQLVAAWEQEKAAWVAVHGSEKSWLDLAMEAQARAAQAVEDATLAQPEPPRPTPPSLEQDKVAKRNAARFAGASAPPAPVEAAKEDLTYE